MNENKKGKSCSFICLDVFAFVLFVTHLIKTKISFINGNVLLEENIQNICRLSYFETFFFYMEKGRLNHISSIKSECKLLRRKKITYSVLSVTLVGKTDCETSNAFSDFSQ